MKLMPKNWKTFQHYSDRNPPWIKLHKEILDDKDFMRLPIASKGLASMLWLLASESKDGVFDASTDELSFRLRMTENEVTTSLKPLIDKGFFNIVEGMLAECLQDARPETERETETETDKPITNNKYTLDFETFWKLYDKPAGKSLAMVEWRRIKPDADLLKMVCVKANLQASVTEQKFRKDAVRWLKGRCWEDEIVVKKSNYDDIFSPKVSV